MAGKGTKNNQQNAQSEAQSEQALTQSQNSMAKHHEMQQAPEGQAMDMTGM